MDPNIECRTCDKVMANAITVSCCQTVMCRGCAVRSLVRSKRCGNTKCLKISSLDQVKLTPNLEIRSLCEQTRDTGNISIKLGKEPETDCPKMENIAYCGLKDIAHKKTRQYTSADSSKRTSIIQAC